MGSQLPTGTVVQLKPGAPINSQLSGGATTNGAGAQIAVIGGYGTSATSSTPAYTSLGRAFTTTHATIGGTGTAGTLVGDMPVDATIAGSYYGNPVTGTNSTLNLSGQFFTLNGAQVAPTKLNKLASDGGQDSTSGNGWDIGFGTGTLSTGSGDLRVYSGPAHAVDGPGYVKGGAADLNIFTNPPASTFG